MPVFEFFCLNLFIITINFIGKGENNLYSWIFTLNIYFLHNQYWLFMARKGMKVILKISKLQFYRSIIFGWIFTIFGWIIIIFWSIHIILGSIITIFRWNVTILGSIVKILIGLIVNWDWDCFPVIIEF